jgi:hypothetical protein
MVTCKPAHKVTLVWCWALVPLTRLSRDERFEQTQTHRSVRLHGAGTRFRSVVLKKASIDDGQATES